MIKSVIKARHKSSGKEVEVYPRWREAYSDYPYSDRELEFDIDEENAYISIAELRRLFTNLVIEGVIDVKQFGIDQIMSNVMQKIKQE